MKRKIYTFMLSDKDRKRHEHMAEKGKVFGFVVQYEILYDNKWMPVIRYDTAHGYAHKDLTNPDGSSEKIFIGITDFNEALLMADKDINENWGRYKERYFRRIKK
ncbi:MAG: hypothetical protein COZ31_04460 [Nitrospirae bacterium CG_4_10_14_3_um_filter_44_29]|nr:MAG: hypothetical protein COW90_06550 [Nitrospirae bacterium CG22_combo_CG10-13_8_21_14_all_44_11]PIX88991.1 MAG: hypothetical protein COZ31_04460 [Nitrospirae bacterium CG_4_10_14_3_um_filter_44_29]